MNEAGAWQAALREKFPGTIVRRSTRVIADPVPVLDVFMVKDEEQFILFLLNERLDFIEEKGLPDADLIPHSIEATIKYFPEAAEKSGQATAMSSTPSHSATADLPKKIRTVP